MAEFKIIGNNPGGVFPVLGTFDIANGVEVVSTTSVRKYTNSDGHSATYYGVFPDDGGSSQYLEAEVVKGTVTYVAKELPGDFFYMDNPTGADTIIVSESGETIYGDGRSARLVGGDDTIFGLGGDDILFGGPGDDTLDGGEGLDAYNTTAFANSIVVNATPFDFSVQSVIIDLGISQVTLGAFTSILANATPANTALDGFGGTDTLLDIEFVYGSNFDDLLVASRFVSGRVGNDALFGSYVDSDNEAGHEDPETWVRGGTGNDLLVGNRSANDLEGQEDDDHIFGGAGDDTIIGVLGSDFIDGGDGIDSLNLYSGTFYGALDVYTLNLSGSDFSKSDLMDRIEQETGSSGALWLAHVPSAVTAQSYRTPNGDTGTIVSVEQGIGTSSIEVMIAGNAGPNEESYLFGNSGNDVLIATDGNNAFAGSDGDDLLLGAANRDILRGGREDDVLIGFGGDDQLFGDEGEDTLYGGDNDDILSGGADIDTLFGGSGNDKFKYFSQDLTSTSSGTRYETIKDFESGSDKIDVSSIDADSAESGNQYFRYVGETSEAINSGEIGWRRIGNDIIVSGRVGGVFGEIKLGNTESINAADFIGIGAPSLTATIDSEFSNYITLLEGEEGPLFNFSRTEDTDRPITFSYSLSEDAAGTRPLSINPSQLSLTAIEMKTGDLAAGGRIAFAPDDGILETNGHLFLSIKAEAEGQPVLFVDGLTGDSRDKFVVSIDILERASGDLDRSDYDRGLQAGSELLGATEKIASDGEIAATFAGASAVANTFNKVNDVAKNAKLVVDLNAAKVKAQEQFDKATNDDERYEAIRDGYADGMTQLTKAAVGTGSAAFTLGVVTALAQGAAFAAVGTAVLPLIGAAAVGYGAVILFENLLEDSASRFYKDEFATKVMSRQQYKDFLGQGPVGDIPINSEFFPTDQPEQHEFKPNEAQDLKGSPAELDGDSATNFSSDDTIIVTNTNFSRSDMTVTYGSAILDIDLDGNSSSDLQITLLGDFLGGEFMVFGQEPDTIISFAPFIPKLVEQQSVAANAVNGIVNKSFLTGDGATDFRITLTDQGVSGFANVVGVYEVDQTGKIVNTIILFDDAKNGPPGGVVLSDVASDHELGLFLVQGAAVWFDGLADDDTFSFLKTNGTAATVDNSSDVNFAVNGLISNREVFHSMSETLNSDGLEHVLSGVEPGGETILVGFEDLTGGGDNDFQDVILRIERIAEESELI